MFRTRKATVVTAEGRRPRSDTACTMDPRALWRPFCGPDGGWGGVPEGCGRREGSGGRWLLKDPGGQALQPHGMEGEEEIKGHLGPDLRAQVKGGPFLEMGSQSQSSLEVTGMGASHRHQRISLRDSKKYISIIRQGRKPL